MTEYPFKGLPPRDEVLEREGYYKDWTHLDPEVFYSLTQISEYIKTKGYGVDVRLLISQLAEHFGLKTTQVVDLANLLQQKFDNLEGVTQSFTNNINSLVAQMEADKDEVIANATVDSEVILARGGKPTLQARLDDSDAQLAETRRDGVVDLVLFMGQSNMAGRGDDLSKATVLKDGEGYEFRAISDPTKLYKAVEPFGVNENNPASGLTESTKTGGMVTEIMKRYYDKTRIPIVGVSASKGGTSINLWQPNGGFLNDVTERFNKAKTWLESNGYTIRHKYMVWCQGETDGDNNMAKTEYKNKFNAMNDYMLSLGVEKTFLIRIGNHRDNASKYDAIMQAQTEISKENTNVVLISTRFASMAKEGLMKDQFHYTQEGYNITGKDSGEHMAFYVNSSIKPYMYDFENKDVFFPYDEKKQLYYSRHVYPLNSDGENGLELNNVGTFSDGKIVITDSNSGKKRLDIPFEVSRDKEWTIEVIAGSTSSTSSGVVLSEGVSTGGFLNLPNGRQSIYNEFQFRDSARTFNAAVNPPVEKKDGGIHQYAVTCKDGMIRMFIDYEEYTPTVVGDLKNFNLKYMFGGFDPAGDGSFDFVGECLYLAITDGKALEPDEMHVE